MLICSPLRFTQWLIFQNKTDLCYFFNHVVSWRLRNSAAIISYCTLQHCQDLALILLQQLHLPLSLPKPSLIFWSVGFEHKKIHMQAIQNPFLANSFQTFPQMPHLKPVPPFANHLSSVPRTKPQANKASHSQSCPLILESCGLPGGTNTGGHPEDYTVTSTGTGRKPRLCAQRSAQGRWALALSRPWGRTPTGDSRPCPTQLLLPSMSHGHHIKASITTATETFTFGKRAVLF